MIAAVPLGRDWPEIVVQHLRCDAGELLAARMILHCLSGECENLP